MNKFTLKAALVASLLLGGVSSAFAFSGGTGVADDPYLIGTSADLVEFSGYAADDASHYKLTANVDMDGKTYTNNQKLFKGTIDGDGYVISNLTIATADVNVGFIANANRATIKNLGFDNISVSGNTVTARMVGGIVGVTSGSGDLLIENCFVKGSIAMPTSTNSASGVGGILGKVNNAKVVIIKNCFVDATISTKVAKNIPTGGFIGQVSNVSSEVEIRNSVFYGILSAGTKKDPVLGLKQHSGAKTTFENLFYAATSAATSAFAATKVTVLDDVANYTNLDFTNTWVMANDRAELKVFQKAPAIESNITYVGLEDAENTNPATYTDQEELTLVAPGVRNGFAFAGWFTNAEMADTVATPAIALGITGDITFYAKWVACTSSDITYNGVDGAENTNPAMFNDLESVTLVAPGAREGFVFAGWFTNAEMTEAVTVPAIAVGTTEAKTFYAKWDVFVPFMISSMSWNGVESGDLSVEGDSEATATFDYVGSNDSLYFIVSSKTKKEGNDNYYTSMFWKCIKVGFPLGATQASVTFTVKDFSDNIDDDSFRVFLSKNNTNTGAAWNVDARYDVAGDADFHNDAIYGTIVESISTGADTESAAVLSVYPNPVEDVMTVELVEDAMVEVYNLSGTLVYAAQGVAGENTVDLSAQASGIYMLMVKGETSTSTMNVVVK